MNSVSSILGDLRITYHKELQQTAWYNSGDENIPSNADKGSRTSKLIARGMLEESLEPGMVIPGQTAGKNFTDSTLEFLRRAFARLQHIRPGSWSFHTSQASTGIAAFKQYEHLAVLQDFLKGLQRETSDDKQKDLRAAFASDYLITPDIVIAREPMRDDTINMQEVFLRADETLASLTPLRAANSNVPILHASVSCKWTLRSDRAQNARTEALNLIRNRKGNTPHIVVVTGEPLPTRLASIALGTGDIDCVYHMALYELEVAVQKCGNDSEEEMFATLVTGHRLRDISDLPLDLAT